MTLAGVEGMRPALSLACLFLLTLPSCVDSEDPATNDLATSDVEASFESVTLHRSSGNGFCVNTGVALSSRVYRDNGLWYSQATVLELAPAGTDPSECLLGEARCVIAVDKPASVMSVSELEAVSLAVDLLPARQCEVDENLACEPCLLTDVTVDSASYSSHCCGSVNREYSEGFDGLTRAIDSLSK